MTSQKKLGIFARSNRSQASFSTDHSSSISSEHHSAPLNRYRSPEEQDTISNQTVPARSPSHRHSSTFSLETTSFNAPPAGVTAAEPPTSVDRIPAEQRYSYGPQQANNTRQNASQPPDKSKRRLFGLRHSSKESADPAQSSNSNSRVGRSASVRKKVVATGQGYPPAQPPQQHLWPPRQSSNLSQTQLAPSVEQDEDDLDPYLVQNPQASPVPPPKDPQYSGYSPHPIADQFGRTPQAVRVNTDQSYHSQGGADHYSSEQQFAHQQPQYQAYQQPQTQYQPTGNQPYQPYQPPASPHPGPPQIQQPQDFQSQQNYSPQQQQQDFQHLQAPGQSLPPQQQEYLQQQGLHPAQQNFPQQSEVYPLDSPSPPPPQVFQQQDATHLQSLRPPSQQQYVPPSPQSFQAYDPQAQHQQPIQQQQPQQSQPQSTPPQQQGTGPVQDNQQPQPAAGVPAASSLGQKSTVRAAESKSNMPPGPPAREISALGQHGQSQQATQGQPYRGDKKQPGQNHGQDNESGRGTPPLQNYPDEELSKQELIQSYDKLVQEHNTLKEKYQKVKRYFFEQQNQVHQLQNTLAHQRLSVSRTSLDDSEYSNRFERLNGLIGQLAFSIRKDWKLIPQWLHPYVNKDAITVGKFEMTGVGKAVISKWLVDEVFDKYFHPDLEPNLSSQLRQINQNIRKFGPLPQSKEEEEGLISKVVTWRLATLEGLETDFKGPQSTKNRDALTEKLTGMLRASLEMYLQEPPPPELENGIPMIVAMAVRNIAIHIPLESREVHIEYFMPNHAILGDFMRFETNIPPLKEPCSEALAPVNNASDAAERASLKSTASDLRDSASGSTSGERESSDQQTIGQPGNSGLPKDERDRSHASIPEPKKQKFSFFGTKKPPVPASQQQARQAAGAGGSQVSLSQQPPGSSGGPKEEPQPPRVRFSTGMAVQIRGKSVLVKASVVQHPEPPKREDRREERQV